MNYGSKEALPHFKYHPNPLETGVIVKQPITCTICGTKRPYSYLGPLYAEEETNDQICPWCIADGRAAAAGLEFSNPDIPTDFSNASAIEELTKRTPSFSGWAPEQWLIHCNDFCSYQKGISNADLTDQLVAELMAVDKSLSEIATLLADTDVQKKSYLDRMLDGERPFRLHLFECLSCGVKRGYLDYADDAVEND